MTVNDLCWVNPLLNLMSLPHDQAYETQPHHCWRSVRQAASPNSWASQSTQSRQQKRWYICTGSANAQGLMEIKGKNQTLGCPSILNTLTTTCSRPIDTNDVNAAKTFKHIANDDFLRNIIHPEHGSHTYKHQTNRRDVWQRRPKHNPPWTYLDKHTLSISHREIEVRCGNNLRTS